MKFIKVIDVIIDKIVYPVRLYEAWNRPEIRAEYETKLGKFTDYYDQNASDKEIQFEIEYLGVMGDR